MDGGADSHINHPLAKYILGGRILYLLKTLVVIQTKFGFQVLDLQKIFPEVNEGKAMYTENCVFEKLT